VTVAEVEAAIDDVIGMFPDDVAAMVGDITVHVARDRADLPVIKAALKDAGVARAEIPQDFRGMYLGEYLEADGDDADDVEPLQGVMLLNASKLATFDDLLFTVLHEVGHALGYDEDEVAALGLE